MARRPAALLAMAIFLIAACGQTTPVASHTPTATASPSASASQGASPAASPTPSSVPAATRLVIVDYNKNQVRLARFDAVDVAAVTGTFDGVVDGQAIVIDGQTLKAIGAGGTVRTLGHLAGKPQDTGPGSVAVNPTLTEWVYTLFDFSDFISHIHLGSATGDKVIASVPPPSDASYYQPFTWNASGVYMVKQPTGLGGAGPFLDYHFPLVTLNIGTGKIGAISPDCIGEGVLDDGTLLCRVYPTGGLEVRPPNGSPHLVQIATGTTGFNGVFTRLVVSADQRKFVAVRNGNANPDIANYQMAVADLTAAKAATFGPIDFEADTYLPDGRVVADHVCASDSCNHSLDGTWFISSDGKSRSLFYKLAQSVTVVGWI